MNPFFFSLPLGVERFQRLPNVLLRESRIASGRLNVDVAQLFLYDTQILRATQ